MFFFFCVICVEKLKCIFFCDKIFYFMFIIIIGEMKRIEYFFFFIKFRYYSYYMSLERMNEQNSRKFVKIIFLIIGCVL